MKKAAFTLVELLVVIAIIAVLMSILMPSLRAAKDHAVRVHCVSNVKTLSLAWFMYKDDNDDKLVGGHVGGPPNWVRKPPNNGTVEQKKQAIKDGNLFRHVGDTVDVYRCPADRRVKDPDQFAYRSYSIAGAANGENSRGSTIATKYSDLKNPSLKYIFVEDIDPRGFNVGSWIIRFASLEWVDPLAMWHRERTTIGFADGHAEMHRWEDKYFIDWCEDAMYRPKQFKFYKTPPANAMTDIEYMARGYPCKSHE